MDQKIKKEYQQPVLRTKEIELGVFGSYGDDPCSGNGRHGRHGHRGGGRGGGGFGGWPWTGD
jgi:hypothetical protein